MEPHNPYTQQCKEYDAIAREYMDHAEKFGKIVAAYKSECDLLALVEKEDPTSDKLLQKRIVLDALEDLLRKKINEVGELAPKARRLVPSQTYGQIFPQLPRGARF